MTRFYFHYSDGETYTPDEQGIEYPSAEDAYLKAYEGAVDIWVELLRERRDPRRCSFEVTNNIGQVVFELPFMEILETCGRRRDGGNKLARESHSDVATARRRALSLDAVHRALESTLVAVSESRKLLAAVENAGLE